MRSSCTCTRWSRAEFVVPFVALWCTRDAFAVWGQNWGTMVWEATMPSLWLAPLALLVLGVAMRFPSVGTLTARTTSVLTLMLFFSLTAPAATPGDHLSGATADYMDSEASQLVAWDPSNSGSSTHEVGGKTANQLSVYDMSGNVFEWCWDWHGAYGAGPVADPTGSGTSKARVIRGGSWNISASFSRVGERGMNTPSFASSYVGFRAVLPPSQ